MANEIIINKVDKKVEVVYEIDQIISQYYIDNNIKKDYIIKYNFDNDFVEFDFENSEICGGSIMISMTTLNVQFISHNYIVDIDPFDKNLKNIILAYLEDVDKFDKIINK